MRGRDHRDESRSESPLAKAPDAIAIDTTNLNPQAGPGADDELIEAKIGQPTLTIGDRRFLNLSSQLK